MSEVSVGKNQCSSKVEAIRLLREILAIEDGRPGALPGDALRNLKRSLKILRRDRGHKGSISVMRQERDS